MRELPSLPGDLPGLLSHPRVQAVFWPCVTALALAALAVRFAPGAEPRGSVAAAEAAEAAAARGALEMPNLWAPMPDYETARIARSKVRWLKPRHRTLDAGPAVRVASAATSEEPASPATATRAIAEDAPARDGLASRDAFALRPRELRDDPDRSFWAAPWPTRVSARSKAEGGAATVSAAPAGIGDDAVAPEAVAAAKPTARRETASEAPSIASAAGAPASPWKADPVATAAPSVTKTLAPSGAIGGAPAAAPFRPFEPASFAGPGLPPRATPAAPAAPARDPIAPGPPAATPAEPAKGPVAVAQQSPAPPAPAASHVPATPGPPAHAGGGSAPPAASPSVAAGPPPAVAQAPAAPAPPVHGSGPPATPASPSATPFPPAPGPPAARPELPSVARGPALVLEDEHEIEQLSPAEAARDVVVASAGFLGGSGALGGALRNGGVLSPGHSPGFLHVAGDLLQEEAGRLEIELAGTAEADYDRIVVEGIAELSGIVEVLLLYGFAPAAGDRCDVLEAASIDYADAVIILPDPLDGVALRLELSERDARQILSVVAYASGGAAAAAGVPEPGAAALLGLGGLAGAAIRSRRRPGP